MFSATAIADFLACQHLTALNRARAEGQIKKPYFPDPGLELLKKLGLAHEQAYLRQLAEERGLEVSMIPDGISWNEAAAQTIALIQCGAEVIYQATFRADDWHGKADFLIRVDKPGGLGDWSYEVVETKLARSTKARAIIQLCFYSDLLSRIQGVVPDYMHVVLGRGALPEKFFVQRYLAYFRKVRREFEVAYQAGVETYPEPVELCRVCDWSSVCDRRWRDDDHLSLVAGITRNQRKVLIENRTTTVVELGRLALPAQPKIERIGDQALLTIREQARLQVKGREEGHHIYELLVPPEAEKGLCSLPPPSPGDMFLDFEGDQFAFDQGLEYLFGVVTLSDEPGSAPVYTPVWAFDRGKEKNAFESFIATVMERLRRYPDMHIYHYGAYEETAIKRMAGQHATCGDEVDQLLRGDVLINLYRAVQQGLRASVESYSIKKLEPLYEYNREVHLLDANLALQTFQAVLAFGRGDEDLDQICDAIAGYNRDDCMSTLRLRDWLEDRRRELEATTGARLPRPVPKEGEPGEDLSAYLERVRGVADRLTADLPADETEWTVEQRGRWLLAQLLEWHRREDKSAWWEYFRRCELTDEELQRDKSALGGLAYLGPVEAVKRSIIHRYQFPLQDHAIDRAPTVHDPKTQSGVGEIIEIDERALTIDIKRGASSVVVHPTALVPYEIMGSKVLRESLLQLASWVAENGINGQGDFQAARDLLLRKPPRLRGTTLTYLTAANLQSSEIAKQVALALDSTVLPIQGPPGSGKTYTGARMIVELVRNGLKVGITAVSHKVISTLLEKTCKAAAEAGIDLRAIQKVDSDDGCDHGMVKRAKDNDAVPNALAGGEAQVAAGTVWLWSRDDMASAVDVLFVDEAGQMSLANVLAASKAAGSVVLLGDPQQLDQPQRGVHPPGAEASALSHLLNGRSTIGEDQGLFLAESWRLHPDVCKFTSEVFYDSRLLPRPENATQRLNAQGPLDGTGLRFAPVNHSGNQSESSEEVEVVAEIVGRLLRDGTTWTNKKGEVAPLLLEDILIVAPYNAQVSALAQSLPVGARVGTVDKFQGQEAPVVIYSMTTSTPEDAPRGMEFLYSSNRLNVATSRAQCVTVLVANPGLFDVQCKTPRQMELANAFCRYLEMAQSM
jgi:predicted RecB family nuclease